MDTDKKENAFVFIALLSVRIVETREDFGMRWQSAAATPLFDCGQGFQSGVALRFPLRSKKIWLQLCRAVPFAPFAAQNQMIFSALLSPIVVQSSYMGYALAKEQQDFVSRLVKSGRFNNQSEAVRESLRRMQRQETDYLTPPPLTPAQVEAIYGREDRQAATVGRGAFRALKATVRKGAKP